MKSPLIIGIGLAIISSYFLRHAFQRCRKAFESQNWPTANGVLIRVQLWGKRLVNSEMQAANKLFVEYEYTVQENKYTGSSVTFYTLMFPETFNFAQNHPENSNINVFYNPSDPSESVLIPGLRKDKPYSDLIIAAFAIITGIALALMAWFGVIG